MEKIDLINTWVDGNDPVLCKDILPEKSLFEK